MRKAIIYIVILAVVCTGFGMVLGVTLCKRQVQKRLPQIIQAYHRGTSVEARINERYEQVMSDIGSKLNLTPEQVDKIRAIYKQIVPESEAIAKRFNDELSGIRKRVIDAIFEVLNPTQGAQFQKMLDEIQKKTGIKSPKKME